MVGSCCELSSLALLPIQCGKTKRIYYLNSVFKRAGTILCQFELLVCTRNDLTIFFGCPPRLLFHYMHPVPSLRLELSRKMAHTVPEVIPGLQIRSWSFDPTSRLLEIDQAMGGDSFLGMESPTPPVSQAFASFHCVSHCELVRFIIAVPDS